jgi:hypothetical protein
MGQEGLPISFAIIIAATIFGAMFLVGLALIALFLA